MKKNHIIWSNMNLNYEDWKADLEEQYPDMTEDELERLMWDLNAEYLDDERVNLNVPVSNGIIAIAVVGTWRGARNGYKEIDSNISDCLYTECDYAEWYIDGRGDLCGEFAHHDGKNLALYRAWKEGVTDAQKKRFEEKILNGTLIRSDVTRYTRRLGDDIADVYGFEIRGKRKAQQGERRIA